MTGKRGTYSTFHGGRNLHAWPVGGRALVCSHAPPADQCLAALIGHTGEKARRRQLI
jgi:hypothetical protein